MDQNRCYDLAPQTKHGYKNGFKLKIAFCKEWSAVSPHLTAGGRAGGGGLFCFHLVTETVF